MALERSWLSVVEVAKESRRRFSGRADAMVRYVLGDGHDEGAEAQDYEKFRCLSFFLSIWRAINHVSAISYIAPRGFLPNPAMMIRIEKMKRCSR